MALKRTIGKNLTLVDWIETKGSKNVAELLGVTMGNITSWKDYRCLPKAETMRKIVKHTDGIVSYESMIEDFFKNNKK